MTQTRSLLQAGEINLVIPINPYTVEWGYNEIATSQDTIGGRVVQLLAVNVDDLTINSVAGSRRELQRLAEGIRQIMEFHIETSRPAKYKVPSRGWEFTVYVKAMPQIGWDVAATTYPYSLVMAVQEDLSGIKTRQIAKRELTRLADKIGYNPGFHGGDAETIIERVESLTSIAQQTATGQGGAGTDQGTVTAGPGAGSNTSANPEQWHGDNRWPGKARTAPWVGDTLRDAVYNIWVNVAGVSVARRIMCIVERESGWNPSAKGVNTNGSWDLGLMQVNTGHAGGLPSQGWPVCSFGTSGCPHQTWWPNDYNQLFDPEYNVRCGIDLYQRAGNSLDAWSTTHGNNAC